MLDEPKGTKDTFGFSTGGWTATPMAKEMISRAAPLLGILPVDEKSPKMKAAMHLNYKSGKEKHAVG